MHEADGITIEEMIITMVKSEPCFFNKSFETNRNIKSLRHEKLNEISQAIFSIFQILITEDEILKKWENLYKKFREEYKKETAYQPSGSAATNIYKSNWPYYRAMNFLIPHVQHRNIVSSIDYITKKNLEDTEKSSLKDEKIERSRNVNKFQRKIKENNEISLLLQASDSINSCLEKYDESNTSETKIYDNYLPLIIAGYKEIAETEKFKCTASILSFIQTFKQNLE